VIKFVRNTILILGSGIILKKKKISGYECIMVIICPPLNIVILVKIFYYSLSATKQIRCIFSLISALDSSIVRLTRFIPHFLEGLGNLSNFLRFAEGFFNFLMELDHFALNFPLPPYDSSSYKLCH
jgi:hypothetical protein